MECDLEHNFSIEDFNMIIDKLVCGMTNPNTDNVLGLENHGISDTYYDCESLLNLTPSDLVNSDGEVFTPSLRGDRQPDQLQGHGSPRSSVSTSDDDSPFSPLSEGAETMTWSPEQQAAAEALGSHQRESDPGSPSVAVIDEARMGMTKPEITTEGHNQSSSSSLPAPAIQILDAIQQSSTGESTSQQPQSLANHLPVRQDCSNVFEGNKLNTSHRGAKRKAQVFHEEEEECHSPGSPGNIKISRNEKNAIAARENRRKKKRELDDLKSTNAAQEKEIVSLHKTSSEQSTEIMLLSEELEYYKRVLFDDSALSTLLRSMNPTPTIKLDSVFRGRDTRDKNSDNTKTGSSGGICLHVCGNSPHVSLQFCPTCASKVHTTFDS